jgi:hypothetical protein
MAKSWPLRLQQGQPQQLIPHKWLCKKDLNQSETIKNWELRRSLQKVCRFPYAYPSNELRDRELNVPEVKSLVVSERLGTRNERGLTHDALALIGRALVRTMHWFPPCSHLWQTFCSFLKKHRLLLARQASQARAFLNLEAFEPFSDILDRQVAKSEQIGAR